MLNGWICIVVAVPMARSAPGSFSVVAFSHFECIGVLMF